MKNNKLLSGDVQKSLSLPIGFKLDFESIKSELC